MSYWYIVLLSVIIGVVANEHPPNNPPFVLEELTTSAEFRILQRIDQLSQTLSDKIKLLDDRVDAMKRDIRSINLVQNRIERSYMNKPMDCTSISSCIDQNLSRMKKETSEMFNTTNKSLGKMSEQLQSISSSTEQRLFNLEYKLERLPEDTGVYFMQPDTAKNVTFEVSRDLTNNHGFGGNWIVFQRRFNGSVNFYRNWTEYKQGFGDLRGEHWLGLDKLHAILKTRRHELLIVMEDFDGVIAYAHYDDFKIGDESEKYIIKSVGQYSGTAGDSFAFHKDEQFSTYDQDNDKFTDNCAKSFSGAWWFHMCYRCHLNGEYLKDETKISIDLTTNQPGIIWKTFRGMSYSLRSTKMMIRPVA